MSIDKVALLTTIVVGVVAAFPVAARWLRVAQREHYLAPWVSNLAWLWFTKRPLNLVATLIALALTVLALGRGLGAVAIAAAFVIALLPFGLGVRGSTGPLNWTSRLRRLLVAWIVLVGGIGTGLVFLLGPAGVPVTLILAPSITDLALAIAAPIEKLGQRRFLASATKRLRQVAPKIIAITGSYGKTSTKGYVAALLDGSFSVVASPASFNNLMGLSRAVNERVVPGTEVFIAEMGVYGRGEIRELSTSFPPDIAAITTIGEAHLARMGSREVIFQAKSEITERAATVVLPVDEVELAGLAEKCRTEGKRVITVSRVRGTKADVVVDAAASRVTVIENGKPVTATVHIPVVGHAVNLAVAIGIAHAMDVPLATLAKRLAALPEAPHRAEIQEAPSGVLMIDDTYNSNPVGAARAVEGAAKLAKERGGELVVVTPGMVELGTVQFERNKAFAASVAAAGGHLIVVGRTNRLALVEGNLHGPHPTQWFARRSHAVQPALDQAGDRGVILYENDLPDHYP